MSDQEDRLTRMEEKIDKLSDAVVSIARAEEKLIQLGTLTDVLFKKIDDMQTQEKGVVESLFDSIANSIEYIFQDEEIFYANEHSKEELLDFLNSLNNNQFEELRNFFSSMPSIQHKEHYTCPKCGSEEELILSTVEDFFA